MKAITIYHLSNTLQFLMLVGYGTQMIWPWFDESLVKPLYVIVAAVIVHQVLNTWARRKEPETSNPLLSNKVARVFYYVGFGTFFLAIFLVMFNVGRVDIWNLGRVVILLAMSFELVALIISYVSNYPREASSEELLDDIEI